MKYLLTSFLAITISATCIGQGLIGTWQLTDEKTCFKSEMKESDTELELKEAMGPSRQSVVRMITFNKKGAAEEGIYSQGKKKGDDTNKFNYSVIDNELQFIDKKSGMATQRFIIDELTHTTLRIHNVLKDCEVKTYTRLE
ncbi:MAG: hypothetical protein JNL53_02580 [Cyclobacteriaceae bacterium]|nr:hypothetical protein [Cyclobacteriaceae bacterium]